MSFARRSYGPICFVLACDLNIQLSSNIRDVTGSRMCSCISACHGREADLLSLLADCDVCVLCYFQWILFGF